MRLSSILIGGVEYIDLALCKATQKQKGLDGEIGSCTIWLLSPERPWSTEFTSEFGPDDLTILNREIIVTNDGGSRWFAGYISSVGKVLFGSTSRLYQLECQDYTVRLETKIHDGKSFSTISNREIVRSLFASYLPEINCDDVQHIADIPSAVYEAGRTLGSILQEHTTLIGGHFFVDYNKRLKYFSEGSIMAPFNLDENVVGILGTGAGALFGDDSLFGDDGIFGGDGTGSVPAVAWLRQGMQYKTVNQTPCNRVTVRGVYEPDTVTFISGPLPGFNYDAVAQQEKSPSWPPIGGIPAEGASADLNASMLTAKAEVYTDSGNTYYRASTIYLEFNTSAIPDDAQIDSVSLLVSGNFIVADGGVQVGIQYIPPQSVLGSYSHASGNDAWGYDVPFFTYPPTGSIGTASFLLKNLTNINKTGNTALRICLKTTGAPVNGSSLNLTSTEGNFLGSGNIAPVLHIGYRVLGTKIEVTLEDADSIAEIAGPGDDGVRADFILEPKIKDIETATLRAQYELDTRAEPTKTGSLAVLRTGLDIGQTVQITCPSLAFDEAHLITRLTENWFGGSNHITLTGIEFGRVQPGVAMKFKKMEQSLKQIGAL